uniref:SprT-like domain-containing protein n=1 Tax=Mycena chlorophos TaxID=658473 RepID=A0ABQ0L4V1_MYCCL|nr:predicted protein [Mycena chlorophos]
MGFFERSHTRHHRAFYRRDGDRVAGGYRAALTNPNTTRQGRRHAKAELHAMGRSAHVPFMDKLRRALGIRKTSRRQRDRSRRDREDVAAYAQSATPLVLRPFLNLQLWLEEENQPLLNVATHAEFQPVLALAKTALNHLAYSRGAFGELRNILNQIGTSKEAEAIRIENSCPVEVSEQELRDFLTQDTLDVVFKKLAVRGKDFAWAYVNKDEDGNRIYVQLALARALGQPIDQAPQDCPDANRAKAGQEFLFVQIFCHEIVHAAMKKMFTKLATPKVSGFVDDTDPTRYGSNAGATFEQRLMGFLTEVVIRRKEARKEDWLWFISDFVARENDRRWTLDQATLRNLTASFSNQRRWIWAHRLGHKFVFSPATHEYRRGEAFDVECSDPKATKSSAASPDANGSDWIVTTVCARLPTFAKEKEPEEIVGRSVD